MPLLYESMEGLLNRKSLIVIFAILIIITQSVFSYSNNLSGSTISTHENVSLEPGDTYYLKISNTNGVLDESITIRIPEKGLYIIYLFMITDFELNYPLERDLEVHAELQLYDENNQLVEKKTLKAVNDEMVVANFFNYVRAGTYRLRIYSDKLLDSTDSSQIKIVGIGIIINEFSDLVTIEPGQGVEFPQYVYGIRKDIDFFISEPRSDYSDWNNYNILLGILNDLDMETSFYIDKFMYNEEYGTYELTGQSYVKIPGHRIRIISISYNPSSKRFYHYWKNFDNSINLVKNSFAIIYPYNVDMNTTINPIFSRILPYDYLINTYSVFFRISWGRDYILYVESSSPLNLKIYESTIIGPGEDFHLKDSFENVEKKLYFLRTNVSSTYILPLLEWKNGDLIPDSKLIISQLNKLKDNNEITIPVSCNKLGWSYAFNITENTITQIRVINVTAHIVIWKHDGATNSYTLSSEESLLVNTNKGDILLIYGTGPAQEGLVNIRTLKRGVMIKPLQDIQHIDIGRTTSFNLTFNIVNNYAEENNVVINIETPDFIEASVIGGNKIVLEPMESKNITIHFRSTRIGYGNISISFSSHGKIIYEHNVLADWDPSLISAYMPQPNYTVPANGQIMASLQILNNYNRSVELYIDIKSLNPEIAGVEAPFLPANGRIIVGSGQTNMSIIITGIEPGNTYILISIYKTLSLHPPEGLITSKQILVEVTGGTQNVSGPLNITINFTLPEKIFTTTPPSWAKGPLEGLWRFVNDYYDIIRLIGILATIIGILAKLISRTRRG